MPDLRIGQLASDSERFCPLAAVNKWPYRHLHGDASQKVSDAFFAAGAFRIRGWTVYYIRTLTDTATKPLLLIPRSEVELLFKDIWATLQIPVTFPNETKYPGFDIGFTEQGSPRPHYLGRLDCATSLIDLEALIPDRGMAPEEAEILDDRSFPAFRRKMEAAIQAGKNRSKANRERKKVERLAVKSSWCAQLKRAQCYLGIRPRGIVRREDFHSDPNLNWEQSQAAQAEYEKAAGIDLSQPFPTSPAPYPFDRDVVFVCVDVESYEKDHTKITEIGVSTLDTRDLVKLALGVRGSEWMKMMRSRHFRIKEHAHLKNTEFVYGCGDQFQEIFGTSEWISIKEAPQIIASCFREPFSDPNKYTPYPSDPRYHHRPGAVPAQHSPSISDDNEPKRNIVLVGHDIQADIQYLRSMGYDVSNLSNLLEAIDTVDLYRAWKHEQSPRNLGAVLLDLELTGWNLHNAGNDAAYTLQSLIGISIGALGSTHKPMPEPEKLDDAARDARDRVLEEAEEWEIADEDGGDGGEAVRVLSPGQAAYKKRFEKGMANGRKADEKAAMRRIKEKNAVKNDWVRQASMGINRSAEREPKGEIKFHTANEAAAKRRAAEEEEDTSQAKQESQTTPHLCPKLEADTTTNRNHAEENGSEIPTLSDRMVARLTSLMDEDDDGNGGVALTSAK